MALGWEPSPRVVRWRRHGIPFRFDPKVVAGRDMPPLIFAVPKFLLGALSEHKIRRDALENMVVFSQVFLIPKRSGGAPGDRLIDVERLSTIIQDTFEMDTL